MTHAIRQPAVPALAPKAEHSSIGDSRWAHLENEADRAADQALSLPEKEVASAHHVPLSRNSLGPGDYQTLPANVLRTLVMPGAPLERELRSDMERRLGHDFSHVRVHADSAAADSARAVDAQAYTVGNHIVFGAGHFAPATRSGRHLIAHELAHVVQQSSRDVTAGTGVLQRKPLRDPASNESSPSLLDETSVPYAAPTPVQPPMQGARAPQTNPLASPAAARNEPSATIPEVTPPTEGETEMPRLVDRFTDPTKPADDSTQREGYFDAEEVDLAELFRALAFGARESHKTVESYVWDSRADVDRSGKAAIKKAGDHAKDANDAMSAHASAQHKKVDLLIDTQKGELARQIEHCKERAGEYATSAKKAYTDGFEVTRGDLAEVFDVWVRRFDKLNEKQAERVKKELTRYRSSALSRAGYYDTVYIRSNTSQSKERAEVQRNAAYVVAEEFIDGVFKVEPEITKALAETTSGVIVQIKKQRDDALEKYKEGLPAVLKGVDDQLAEARIDIDKKGAQVGVKLTKKRAAMHERVNALEKAATKSNGEFATTVKNEVDKARVGADQRVLRAMPHAMKPIGDVVSDAVGLLAGREEELDPQASRKFVGEVVQFSVDAAESTAPIFAGARNKGVHSLAATVPDAKRRFAARVTAFQAQLHQRGEQDELEMTEFSVDTEKYLGTTLTELDGSFQAGMVRAAKELGKMIVDTRETIYPTLENSRQEILKSVNEALGKVSDDEYALRKEIPKAAHLAAWKFDHPIKAAIVRRVEIFLGVVAAGLILIGLVFALPFIVGVEAAAVLGCILACILGFMAGYYGAQSYDERRKAGESGISAFFGAVADVTGITDARRAFTDPKMSDFDRGFAVGNLALALFGFKEGIPRFYKAAKLRFPRLFTNPFKPKVPQIPLEPPARVPGGMAPELPMPELPKPGLPDDLKIPHEGVPAPETTGKPSVLPPDESGFKLPHEDIPGPDKFAKLPEPKPDRPSYRQTDEPLPEPGTSAKAPEVKPTEDLPRPDPSGKAPKQPPSRVDEAPPTGDQPAPDATGKTPDAKPGRAGFELPYEKQPGGTGTPGAGEVDPRLHHRKKPGVAETTPPGPKEPIGFKPPEKAPPEATGTAASGEVDPRLHHRKKPGVAETTPSGPKEPIGFKPPEKAPPEATGTAASGEVDPRLHHRKKPAVPETAPPEPKGPIGFQPPEKTPSAPPARPQTPAPVGEGSPPPGGISQMPPAREVSGTGPHGGGTQPAGNRPPTTMSSSHGTSGAEGRAPGGQGPTKGSVVSSVEPEGASATSRPDVGARQFDAELADELAVREARNRRMAAEDRVAAAERELAAVEEVNKSLGERSTRDFIHDEVRKHKASLEEAHKELADSKRAEIEAEAAERIDLKRRRDLDPAAAKHDPELRQHAEEEYGRRMERLGELDEFIRENEPAITAAEEEVARKQKAFDNAPNGDVWDPKTRTRINARDTARRQLKQAERDLARARGRSADAINAKNKQLERMQDLDEVIAPDDYPQLSGPKGNYGEARMHDAMANKGYEFRGSSKDPKMPGAKPSDKGLDGAYEKLSPAEGEPRHVAGEAKYDTSELRPGQEKWEWVDERLDRAVGPEHANRMRKEGYEYWEMRYNPRTKLVEPTKLWEFRHDGRFAPEQYPGAGKKPLGGPHYDNPNP
jgi:Domain of unknown function (DUF4157)